MAIQNPRPSHDYRGRFAVCRRGPDPVRTGGGGAASRARQILRLARHPGFRTNADETRIDLRKLTDTTVGDVDRYVWHRALVLLEEQRRRRLIHRTDFEYGAAAPAAMPGETSADEQMRGCFERCLERLPRQDRDLAVGYYEGERGVRIANRQRLAAAFQLSDNALRSRVQRLRDQLARCVQTCMSGR